MSLKTLRTGLTLLTMTFATAAFGDAPPRGQVQIHDVRYAGTACPDGTAVANVSPDRQALTVIFNSFEVQINRGQGFASKRCELNLTLSAPLGWSYQIFKIDLRGYVSVSQRGDYAGATARYKFVSSPGPFTAVTMGGVQGPYDSDYHLTGSPGADSPWSPCYPLTILRLDTVLAVATTARSLGAMATVDSIDGDASQTYGLRWRRCR